MSDAGDDQVLITHAEYDELLALRAEKTARARPPEVAAMIAAGHRPLKAWRKYLGWSQAKLAEQGGITQGYLSDIEAGTKSASGLTLHFLARALGRTSTTL